MKFLFDIPSHKLAAVGNYIRLISADFSDMNSYASLRSVPIQGGHKIFLDPRNLVEQSKKLRKKNMGMHPLKFQSYMILSFSTFEPSLKLRLLWEYGQRHPVLLYTTLLFIITVQTFENFKESKDRWPVNSRLN